MEVEKCSMGLVIYKRNDTLTLIFCMKGRSYYLTYNKEDPGMEILCKTKAELYTTFIHLLWFNQVDTIYVYGMEPSTVCDFFMDMAEESNKHGWPFSHKDSMFKIIKVDDEDFNKFRDEKVLIPSEFLELEEDPTTVCQEQCILMHYMILSEELERYAAHITNIKNNT